MAGVKGRSGGRRLGAGRKPKSGHANGSAFVGPSIPRRILFERDFVGPLWLGSMRKPKKVAECPHAKPLFSNGKPRKFCLECQPKRKNGGPRKPYALANAEPKNCAECEKAFVPSARHQKYCSNSCRIRHGNASLSRKEALKKKLQENPVAAMKARLRSRIRRAFRLAGYGKDSSTHEMLGCSFEKLKDHIERQFLNGMSWGNRSKWHIDHIVPLATAKNIADMERLNHYSNLRPMWAADNLAKGSKVLTIP